MAMFSKYAPFDFEYTKCREEYFPLEDIHLWYVVYGERDWKSHCVWIVPGTWSE